MGPAVDLIGTVPLFERLDAALRARIEAITDVVSAEAGEVLSHQGASPEFLYVLLEGQVALSSTAADGTTALVEVLHPIDHFVLASVLTRLPYLMAARTVTLSRLLAIQADGLLESGGARGVTGEHAAALRFARVPYHGGPGARPEVAHSGAAAGLYLLARVKDGEATKADFRLPFDKGLLAARLGCRQENLSRAFATLRAYGVETHGSRVIRTTSHG